MPHSPVPEGTGTQRNTLIPTGRGAGFAWRRGSFTFGVLSKTTAGTNENKRVKSQASVCETDVPNQNPQKGQAKKYTSGGDA